MFGRKAKADKVPEPKRPEVGAMRARVETARYHGWVAHAERWNGSKWESWGTWSDREFGHYNRAQDGRPTGCTIDHRSREEAEAAGCKLIARLNRYTPTPVPPVSYVYEGDCA
jgi:hypothetical protein